tara:strand:- start:312 stop:554 length:243 start_codon:yes stop_codon:yes gene_type:complete
MSLKSTQIVYSEHHYDECFEYKNGKGRVPEGEAIGYMEKQLNSEDKDVLVLFDDIKYSKYDHDHWDNYDLEHDSDRLFVP